MLCALKHADEIAYISIRRQLYDGLARAIYRRYDYLHFVHKCDPVERWENDI